MTQHTNAFPELDRDLRFIPSGVEEPRVLTPGQICRYNEAGHLFPINIFSPAEIADVDVDSSAMQVIPGSHHHAQLTFRDSTATENNVLVQTVDNPADYDDPPVALEIRAGQISLHSDWILHGSEPNRSNRRRCGLAMRYLSADVHAYDGWNAHSVWCRGTDPRNHWAPAPTAS